MPDSDANTTNTGDQDSKSAGFNPQFTLSASELLTLHGKLSHQTLEKSEEDNIRTNLSTYLGIAPSEVSMFQILGVKLLEGKTIVDGDSKVGYEEVEDQVEKIDYIVKMTRRDQFVNFMAGWYGMTKHGLEEQIPTPQKPEDYLFDSPEDSQFFLKTLYDLTEKDPRFDEFVGEVRHFIKVLEGSVSNEVAIFTVLKFTILNYWVSASNPARKEILEGMMIPANSIDYVDILDPESIDAFLNDKSRRYIQAKNIVAYLLHMNSRPHLI